MIYLSSTTSIPDEYINNFGVMFSANYPIGGLIDILDNGIMWMMDNNEFNNEFNPVKWVGSLLKYRKYQENCIGIPIRDKVGDALKTLQLFSQYWRIVKDLGYRVGFVTQDGITNTMVPWNYFDVLFVGGSNDHKLGYEAQFVISEAKERGKWVHIGRVNSAKRMRQFWMADSVDGTTLTKDTGDARLNKIKSIYAACVYCVNKKGGVIRPNGQYQMTEVIK